MPCGGTCKDATEVEQLRAQLAEANRRIDALTYELVDERSKVKQYGHDASIVVMQLNMLAAAHRRAASDLTSLIEQSIGYG